MDALKIAPILFPIDPQGFIDLIRAVVREELEKYANRQVGDQHKVSGLTYKPLYKMDEVCEIFDITPPTIYDWIKKGKLKRKKIRSRVFFLWTDILKLIEEGENGQN